MVARGSATSVESTVDVCGAAVPLLPTIRDIGVILDNGLDMSAQVSDACRCAYFNLFRIAKIRKILDHCSLQNPHSFRRDFAYRLRERSPVRDLRPPVAPSRHGAAFSGQSSATD